MYLWDARFLIAVGSFAAELISWTRFTTRRLSAVRHERVVAIGTMAALIMLVITNNRSLTTLLDYDYNVAWMGAPKLFLALRWFVRFQWR